MHFWWSKTSHGGILSDPLPLVAKLTVREHLQYLCCISFTYNGIVTVIRIGRTYMTYKGIKILIEVEFGRKIELTLKKIHRFI